MPGPEVTDHSHVLDSISAEIWELIPKLPSLLNRLEFPKALGIAARPDEDGKSMVESQQIPEAAQPVEKVIKNLQEIFSRCCRVNDPRFLSFIPSAASFPISWLGDILASAYNAYTGNWKVSLGVTAAEVALIAWLASQVGYPSETAGGVFTSGGSMANLTGLCAARDQILLEDQRHLGVAYMSEQIHFSVSKALRILGITNRQMRAIPCLPDYRIDTTKLQQAIQQDIAKGLVPFAMIGSAGTTNTGAVDDLHTIADIAHEHKMWLHIDGSYGASIALSKANKHLVSGIERADSIAWDAHKWLFQTWGCGIALVRNKNHLLSSFGVDAEYLREVTHEGLPNTWNYGLELTRPARHMRLWFSLQVLGSDLFGQLIDHGITLGKTAEEEFRKLPRWEIVSPATLAILNFRYRLEGPVSGEEEDEFNTAISVEMVARNKAVMMTTQLAGRACLRMCSINPLLSVEEMRQLVKETDMVARELEQQRSHSKHVNGIDSEGMEDDVATNGDIGLKTT